MTDVSKVIRTEIRTFLKKNGEERNMHFIKLEDLPEEFLKKRLKGNNRKKNLSEGLEVVWDLDKRDFRVFNWNTATGTPYHRVMTEDVLFEKHLNT
jgi:hypothetical protein